MGSEEPVPGFWSRLSARLRDPSAIAVLIVIPVFWVARDEHYIAAIPVWVSVGVVIGAWLASSAALASWPGVHSGWRLWVRVGVELGAIAAVLYVIGWGPTLAIGLLFGAVDCIRLSGTRAVLPAIVVSAVAIVLGQVAIATGIAPSLIGQPLVHGLGVLAILGTVFTILFFGRARSETEAAERELQQRERRFRALVQHASDVILVLDREGGLRYVSPAFEAVLGYTPDVSSGAPGQRFAHPSDLGRMRELIAESGTSSASAEVRMRHRDGSWRWFDVAVTNLFDEPSVDGWVANLHDVTERKEAASALAGAQESFRHAFDEAPIGMALTDAHGVILRANQALAHLLGYSEEGLDGKRIPDLTHPLDREEGTEDLKRVFTGQIERYRREKRYLRADGDTVWVAVSVSLVRDGAGEPLYAIGQVEDINERKALSDRLAYEAAHDLMTGLPNRSRFVDRIASSLARHERDPRKVAVLFVDLDQFKLINDGLGHAAGDELLVRIADRLRRALRPGDVVARFGGDEFTVLCDGVTGDAGARELAGRLAATIAEPVPLARGEVFVTASIGIAISGRASSPDTLLREADTAMYRAKAQGPAHVEVFRSDEHTTAMTALKTGTDLHRALERSELVVHYQPIVALETGRVTGFEALVRWNHPERGLLGPGDFIDLAEDTGLIGPIGTWVLETACRQTASWQAQRPSGSARPLSINVNLSPRQLANPTLPGDVAAILARTGLAPSALCLEITENSLMHHAQSVTSALHALRNQGLHLSIDDFGTGYSSLSYLKRLPVESLKIDQSFVAGLGRDPEDTSIVEAVVTLAHALDLTAVAEGLENATQLETLRTIGCDYAQGFLLGAPRAADVLGPRPADDLSVWADAAPPPRTGTSPFV